MHAFCCHLDFSKVHVTDCKFSIISGYSGSPLPSTHPSRSHSPSDFDTSHDEGLRGQLKVRGLLPPHVESFELQKARCQYSWVPIFIPCLSCWHRSKILEYCFSPPLSVPLAEIIPASFLAGFLFFFSRRRRCNVLAKLNMNADVIVQVLSKSTKSQARSTNTCICRIFVILIRICFIVC